MAIKNQNNTLNNGNITTAPYNYTGGSQPPRDENVIIRELQDLYNSAGITADANVFTQLAQAILHYSVIGNSLIYDIGYTANNIILKPNIYNPTNPDSTSFKLPTTLQAQLLFTFIPILNNTGPVTITISTLCSNIPLKRYENGNKIPLASNNIIIGQVLFIVYDGTDFIIINPSPQSLDGNNVSQFNGRDLRINGKRALIGLSSVDGNQLIINYGQDFVNGTVIEGELTTPSISSHYVRKINISNEGGRLLYQFPDINNVVTTDVYKSGSNYLFRFANNLNPNQIIWNTITNEIESVNTELKLNGFFISRQRNQGTDDVIESYHNFSFNNNTWKQYVGNVSFSRLAPSGNGHIMSCNRWFIDRKYDVTVNTDATMGYQEVFNSATNEYYMTFLNRVRALRAIADPVELDDACNLNTAIKVNSTQKHSYRFYNSVNINLPLSTSTLNFPDTGDSLTPSGQSPMSGGNLFIFTWTGRTFVTITLNYEVTQDNTISRWIFTLLNNGIAQNGITCKTYQQIAGAGIQVAGYSLNMSGFVNAIAGQSLEIQSIFVSGGTSSILSGSSITIQQW